MTTCPRAWEVEAARDGRLVGSAREALDAHVRHCAPCAREVAALETLAHGLHALGDAPGDEVAIRRLRNRVLEAVDAEQTGRARLGNRGGRPARLGALALAAMVMGCVAYASLRAPRPRTELAQGPAPAVVVAASSLATSAVPVEREETRVEVSAAAGARCTRSTEAAVDRFELLEGTLRLRVQRSPGGRRVVVAVPDGEVEDVGTAFEVVVADRHTDQVSVEEGRVVVRLTDRAPVTVEAGTAWRRPVAARMKGRQDAGASANANAAVTASSQEEREDQAYLDVLRLMRERREGDARAAASRYLHDFPAGFRRAEMERVAGVQRQR
jgi:hypothetical protein